MGNIGRPELVECVFAVMINPRGGRVSVNSRITVRAMSGIKCRASGVEQPETRIQAKMMYLPARQPGTHWPELRVTTRRINRTFASEPALVSLTTMVRVDESPDSLITADPVGAPPPML